MPKQPALINVVLADPFPPYINGLKSAFKNKPGLVLHPACNIEETLQHLENKNIQFLIITDSLLADSSGCSITRILEKFPALKIIVLIHTVQVPVLKNLVALGASALVSKLTRGLELCEAILHLQQSDQTFYCHRILKTLALKHEIPQYINGKKVSLSPQLVEVLWGMIDKIPYKLIADETELTENTIDSYCKTINKRIRLSQCKSPLEYGVRMGYFTMEQYVKRISSKLPTGERQVLPVI